MMNGIKEDGRLLGRLTGGGSARQLPSVLADSHRATGGRHNNVRV